MYQVFSIFIITLSECYFLLTSIWIKLYMGRHLRNAKALFGACNSVAILVDLFLFPTKSIRTTRSKHDKKICYGKFQHSIKG